MHTFFGTPCICQYSELTEKLVKSDAIKGLRLKFLKWKQAFESRGLKVNLWKTMVMVSNGITQDGLPKSKVDPCGVYFLRVKANSA